jgi:serine/threonine protein phosphatase PrpC
MVYNNMAKSMEKESLESLEPNNSLRNVHLFGVFDGHGKSGRLVSEFIKNRFPNTLKILSKRTTKIPDLLHATFLKLDKDLSKSKIDALHSGSTA